MDINKSYETVFILDSALNTKSAEQIFEQTKNFIIERKGSIIESNNIGFIKFAYSINKKKLGNYFFIEFNINQQHIKDLDIFFKRNDAVMRFLICRLDKNGVTYNTNRRKNKEKIINNQKVLDLIKL